MSEPVLPSEIKVVLTDDTTMIFRTFKGFEAWADENGGVEIDKVYITYDLKMKGSK